MARFAATNWLQQIQKKLFQTLAATFDLVLGHARGHHGVFSAPILNVVMQLEEGRAWKPA